MGSYINYQREEKKWTNDINIYKQKSNFYNQEYTSKLFKEIKGEWRKYCEFWKQYPDYFIDFIKPPDCKIDLYFYQRVYLRILFRYNKVFITATRGTAKTFTQILALYLKCIMYPGASYFICAPGKEQAAKLSRDNIEKIWEYYPILRNEVKYRSFQTDYVKLIFQNNSKLDVVQVKDSIRGGRRHGGAIEEIADEKFDGDTLHSAVIPLMANNRIACCKGVDPDEIHKFQFYITTAGTRQSFAFNKLKEVLGDMVQGKSAFSIGNGYELPCMYDQLDIDFVNEQRESPTYNPLAFQREYESVWTGSSENSLVSLEDLNKCRVLTQYEDKAMDKDGMYVLAYDVARAEGSANADSALIVIKCIPREDGTYIKHLVNIYSFEGTHFLEQARFLKKKVNDFNARILIVDNNTLGMGLTDQLVLDIDENPPYEVINDPRYDKYKTSDSIPMVFALSSQNKDTKSSDIHNVFMSTISNHKVKLLKSESFMKAEIIKKNPKISSEKLAKELYSFTMCDLLCEEIMNLEYKSSGNNIQVKQISKSINKDKFSALEYGLYWIYLEERKNQVRKEESIDLSKMFLFKKPNIRKY